MFLPLLVTVVLLGAAAGSVWLAAGPLAAAVYFGTVNFLSLVAVVAILRDKRAAEAGTWRVSERTLHLLELAGGFPGSLIARHLARHKTVKRSYRVMAWLAALAHGAVVTGLAQWAARM